MHRQIDVLIYGMEPPADEPIPFEGVEQADQFDMDGFWSDMNKMKTIKYEYTPEEEAENWRDE